MSAMNAEDQVINWNICLVHIFCLSFLSLFFFQKNLSVSYPNDPGEVISERDRCPQCKGNKISSEKKVLEVHVEKGMQHGEKISFHGEADQAVSEIKIFV